LGVLIGFLYNGSTFTDIIYPGALQTIALGIDGSNIVGFALVGGTNRGFLYNGSTFTDIIYPGATSPKPAKSTVRTLLDGHLLAAQTEDSYITAQPLQILSTPVQLLRLLTESAKIDTHSP
jgi:hypothetical protein